MRRLGAAGPGAGRGAGPGGSRPPRLGLGPALGRFLAAAYLNGMAVFLVAFAGGMAEGPAALLAILLLAAALKAWAAEPLAELLGLPRRPRPRLALLRALGGLSLALGLLLAASRLGGIPLRAEPFSLALALELLYRAVACFLGALSRVLARGRASLRGEPAGRAASKE